MARSRKRWIARILLLLGGAWGISYLLSRIARAGLAMESDGLLLQGLSVALVVLTLGLAGLLIRDLVKLIVSRRRGVLGSKLQTKLVFFFLALVLLPAIVLFSGSAQVIKETVEAILRTPIDQLTRGTEVVAEWTDHFQDHALQRATALSQELVQEQYAGIERRASMAEILEQQLGREELQVARVMAAGRLLAGAQAALEPEVLEEVTAQLDRMIEQTASDGEPRSSVNRVPGGLVALAAVGVDNAAQPPPVVGVARLVPPEIARSVDRLDSEVQTYRQFRTKRRELVRFYVTLIALVFLATLFVATWIGLYIARRITEPLKDVAAATREISAGNLGVRVKTSAGDEMAILVDAFNEMAGELQESRSVITRSTADLRRSNRALDERRRYIETLVANLSTAVISLDPAGRVTTANPAVETILGFPLLAGDDAKLVLLERGLEPLAELLVHPVQPAAGSIRVDLDLPGPQSVLHVSVQVSPLAGEAAEHLGSLIMMEDISDVLRAQRAVAWREVARRIAHEIKNPLTPIQLAAQRLRKKFFAGAEDLDRVLLESTASIEHEVAGLKQLVDEFSRFARMPEIEPQPVEFVKVVESVLTLYRAHPGIDWEVALDSRIGQVTVDPQQLRRALINLIDNAVAAVEDNGSIRITARPGPAEDSVRIEIADSGPGIPVGDRDKMFAPYFSTKKRGTGLGLAIVHKVVTDHRGTIRVEDNEPHGARFVIDLPTG